MQQARNTISKQNSLLDIRGNIRLDYSDTYQENDILDLELVDKLYSLHKQRYRIGIDRDESLKKARKEANDIKSLSNAIRSKETKATTDILPGEDKQGYVQQISSEQLDLKKDVSTQVINFKVDNTLDIVPRTSSEPDCRSKDEADGPCTITPVNIAMFKLSLRTFQKNITERKGKDYPSTKDRPSRRQRTISALPSYYRPRGMVNLLSRRKRPNTSNTSANPPARELKVLEAMDIHPVALFDLNIRKQKASRSRRELEEISKIQQEEKFGHMEKILEEKNKKIEWAKGGTELEQRIRAFIQDVDNFNKKARGSDLSLYSFRRSRSLIL